MPGTTNQIGNRILDSKLTLENTINLPITFPIEFRRNRDNGTVQTGDPLGEIAFFGFDGSNYPPESAGIAAIVTGPVSFNAVPASLLFFTASTGFVGGVRMTIDQFGQTTFSTPDNTTPSVVIDNWLKFPNTGANRIYVNTDIFEHTSGANNLFLGINSGLSVLGTVITTDNVGIGNTTLANLALGARDNTAIGNNSLNACTSGIFNTAVGSGSLENLTTGFSNIAIGNSTMSAGIVTGFHNIAIGEDAVNVVTSGSNNIGIGHFAIQNTTIGTDNIAIGATSLQKTTTGSFNIAIGSAAGSAYITTNESNNILIQNAGVNGESNVMRLGTTGSGSQQVNKAFIAGTYGVSPTGPNQLVTINANGQLGSTPGGGLTNYTGISFINSPYTVLSTDDYISVTSGGGVISILLPNAPAKGTTYTIKDKNGGASLNNIFVTTVGGTVTIDGQTTYIMNSSYQAINLIFNNVSYEIY